jgi:Tetratricopeptide repeat
MDDFRRWHLAAVLGLSTLVGCQSTSKFTPPAATTTAATPPVTGTSKPSLLSRVFPSSPKLPGTTPTASPELPAKKGPVSNETVVAFADAQVSAVFDTTAEGLGVQGERTLEEARQKYQLVLQKDPTNRDAMLGMARMYTRMGDRDRALGFYDSLTKSHPHDHKIVYERALAYGRFDDWKSAIQSCQQALVGDPENRRYRKTLGIAIARTGNMEDGFKTLLGVMSEAEARFTMAKLMMDNHPPELVMQQLQLASHTDPTFTPARELLSQLQEAKTQQHVQTADYRQPSN